MAQAIVKPTADTCVSDNSEQRSNAIAIVDDDEEERTSKRFEVQDAGYMTYVITGTFQNDREALIRRIMDNSVAAICDHALQPRGMALFSGAELVKELYYRNFPAVLVTQYGATDGQTSIRQHRRYIPVVLSNEAFNGEKLRGAIQTCKEELKGQFRLEREAGRTILRVERAESQGSETFFDVIVPSWHPKQAVRFPASMIESANLRQSIQAGKYLFAKVNTSAQRPEDLYFYDFEDAPMPTEDFLE